MTITHHGREYRVENTGRDNDLETPYLLISERGVRYALLRNKPKPTLLFAIYFDKFGTPSGKWWFSDEGGTLRSLTP